MNVSIARRLGRGIRKNETMTKHELNQKMIKFMKHFESMPQDEQAEIWGELNAIVDDAKLSIIADAAQAIEKLKTFSL